MVAEDVQHAGRPGVLSTFRSISSGLPHMGCCVSVAAHRRSVPLASRKSTVSVQESFTAPSNVPHQSPAYQGWSHSDIALHGPSSTTTSRTS